MKICSNCAHKIWPLGGACTTPDQRTTGTKRCRILSALQWCKPRVNRRISLDVTLILVKWRTARHENDARMETNANFSKFFNNNPLIFCFNFIANIIKITHVFF